MFYSYSQGDIACDCHDSKVVVLSCIRERWCWGPGLSSCLDSDFYLKQDIFFCPSTWFTWSKRDFPPLSGCHLDCHLQGCHLVFVYTFSWWTSKPHLIPVLGGSCLSCWQPQFFGPLVFVSCVAHPSHGLLLNSMTDSLKIIVSLNGEEIKLDFCTYSKKKILMFEGQRPCPLFMFKLSKMVVEGLSFAGWPHFF